MAVAITTFALIGSALPGCALDTECTDPAAGTTPPVVGTTPPHSCVIIDEDIVEDTTLTAADCYVVEGDRTATAELTLEPGVTLQFEAAASLTIEGDASALVAEGTETAPIILTGTQALPGFWKGVLITSNSPLNSMTFVTVEYGGNEGVGNRSEKLPANLYIGAGARVSIEDCRFENSAEVGLVLYGDIDVQAFARNRYSANLGAPLRLGPDYVTLLDEASDFVGAPGLENGELHIVVAATRSRIQLEANSVWRNHGVPYLFDGDSLQVEADLEILPGVTLLLPNGGLIVEPEGSINAIGTAEAPIVFTASTEVGGSWRGVHIRSSSGLNVMDHVDIGYGGRETFSPSSAQPTNLLINFAPARLSLSNSHIHDSQGWGVYVLGDGIFTDVMNHYADNASGDVGFN